MWVLVAVILCSIQMLVKQTQCIYLIDLPLNQSKGKYINLEFTDTISRFAPVEFQKPNKLDDQRRYWLVNDSPSAGKVNLKSGNYEDEKDGNLKSKITNLVEQTLHDTDRKIKSIQGMKEKHREKAPYRAGFILSMVKKSRDVLNELFNVAVKHRDDWKALEQMKIFELIVHTNVDTTNLVRQLVEIHIQHLNTSSATETTAGEEAKAERKRVVLL